MTAAERLAGFATDLRFDEIPTDVVDKAKQHLLDTLGCGLAAHALGVATAPRDALLGVYGDGPATVIGSMHGLPAPAAACANGALFHALEFDDTHPAAIVNVGAFVTPAALALGETTGASGHELLTALVIGSETVVRLGLAAAPSFLSSGFHPAAVCGVFGATLAAARLLSLDSRSTAHALGIAGSTASGLYESLVDGSTTKSIHAGWAAQSGILAALFAQAGADGPTTVFEGRFGVFRSHFGMPGDVLAERLSQIGSEWETRGVAIRPYPVCYMSQSPLDAVGDLIRRGDFDWRDIHEIRVSLPQAGVPIVLEPREAKLAPRSPYDARFSLPFVVAAMLVRGQVDLDTFSNDALGDADVLDLARKVVHAPRDFPTFPAVYPAAVEIAFDNGELLTADVPSQRGSRESPMLIEDVAEKFRANASRALARSAVDALEEIVGTIETARDLQPLRASLRSLSS